MITYWLVALLIGLLLVDFASYLRTLNPPYHARWTIPNSLLFTSSVIAIFCIGLAWRYAVNARNFGITSGNGFLDVAQYGLNIDMLGNWLPYVLVLLALCIIAGFIETWRGPNTTNKPITDPYLLLETSQPIPEPARINTIKQNWLIVRGVTLAFSIVIGFAGAAFLIQFSSSNPETTFFPLERVRPTAQPAAVSPFDESPQPSKTSQEDAPALADAQPTAEPPTEPDHLDQAAEAVAANPTAEPLAETLLAIGGPVSDTPIEEIRSDTDYETIADSEIANSDHVAGNLGPEAKTQNAVATETPPAYHVVVQATLGVKGRTAPSTEGDLVDVLAWGKSYKAIGRTPNGRWLQVELNEATKVWIITEAVDGLLFDINGKIVALDELPSMTLP